MTPAHRIARAGVLAAAVAALAAAPAPAALLNSFESGVDGFADDAGGPALVLGTSAVGATDGAQSLSVQNPGGFGYFASFAGFPNTLSQVRANDVLLVDVTVPATGFASDFLGLRLAFNSDAGGFQQTPDQFFGAAPGTFTVSFPYRDLGVVPGGTATFLGVAFALNVGGDNGPSTVYLDNVRVVPAAPVPEPASSALLLVAAPLVLARRR